MKSWVWLIWPNCSISMGSSDHQQWETEGTNGFIHPWVSSSTYEPLQKDELPKFQCHSIFTRENTEGMKQFGRSLKRVQNKKCRKNWDTRSLSVAVIRKSWHLLHLPAAGTQIQVLHRCVQSYIFRTLLQNIHSINCFRMSEIVRAKIELFHIWCSFSAMVSAKEIHVFLPYSCYHIQQRSTIKDGTPAYCIVHP